MTRGALFPAPMPLEAKKRDIRKDNLSGAQDITGKAASLVLRLVREKPLLTTRALRAEVLAAAATLFEAQPAMAPLYHLFARILARLDHAASAAEAAKGVQSAARSFLREMDEHNVKLARHLCQRIRHGDVLFTHSASRSVRTALLHCWERGKRFSVVCSESRPACEGVGLAQILARRGIPTSLTTDALALSLLRRPPGGGRRAAMALVGADSVAPAGLTNKAGTAALALVAGQCAVPLYALAGSEKFLPAAYPVKAAIGDKPPQEILRRPPRGLDIINRYFDITPLNQFRAVVTEEGFLGPERVLRELKKLRPQRELIAMLKRRLRQN